MNLSRYTREFRYNLKLALPVMAGMLGHTLVQFADNVMVGQLGTAELAAVSLGNSFLYIAISLGIGFSTALTPLVAEAHSEGDYNKGKQSYKHGVILCTLLGLFLFLLLLLLKPLMHLMEQPEEVVALARPYLDLVGLSLIPLMVYQAFKQFSEGLSKTKYPMYATILANLVNVFINYLLIFGKWGFPQLGVAGAAIGTLVSRVAMVLLMLLFFNRDSGFHPYVHLVNWKVISQSFAKKLTGLGIPSAFQMFFEVVIFTAAVWLSGILGKNEQAANQIALNLSSMTFMVAIGFSVAAMIRVGNQKGLKKFDELRRIAGSLFFIVFLIEVLFATLFIVFHKELPWLYLNAGDQADYQNILEVVHLASYLLIVAALFQISDGLQVVVLGALRGLQDVRIPTIITFVAYWVIGFPTSYFLGLHTDLGSIGIWIGLLVGLSSSAIMLSIRFHKLTKRLANQYHALS